MVVGIALRFGRLLRWLAGLVWICAMRDRLVGSVRKNARELILCTLREKRGDVGCDVRIAETKPGGETKETPKGLRIPLGRLDEMIESLAEAKRVAVAEGLLPAEK